MGDFIIAIFINLVTVMIPVQSKTVLLYYNFCGITDQFSVANSVTLTILLIIIIMKFISKTLNKIVYNNNF